MRITINLFHAVQDTDETPMFSGILEPSQPIKVADLKLLWELERAFNDHTEGHCQIDIEE